MIEPWWLGALTVAVILIGAAEWCTIQAVRRLGRDFQELLRAINVLVPPPGQQPVPTPADVQFYTDVAAIIKRELKEHGIEATVHDHRQR